MVTATYISLYVYVIGTYNTLLYTEKCPLSNSSVYYNAKFILVWFQPIIISRNSC